MSLLDNVRQTLGEAATKAQGAAATAREIGQTLSAQAQAQVNLKKLQLEQAKKLHELGAKTYDWYRAGNLVVTGAVPADVQELCRALDDINTRIRAEEARLEDLKAQAELRGQNGQTGDPAMTYTVLPDTNTASTTAETTPAAPEAAPEAAPPTTDPGAQPTVAQAGEGVTMPGTGIITNPTPAAPADTVPPAVPTVPGADTTPTPIPSDNSPIPAPAPDTPGVGIPGSVPDAPTMPAPGVPLSSPSSPSPNTMPGSGTF